MKFFSTVFKIFFYIKGEPVEQFIVCLLFPMIDITICFLLVLGALIHFILFNNMDDFIIFISSSGISIQGVDEVNTFLTKSYNYSNKEFNTKRKVKKIIVAFDDLTETKFIETLIFNLSINSDNTILFQYYQYQSFTNLMLGSQVGIVVRDSHDIKYYKSLFEHYQDMLEITLSLYKVESPDFIIIHLTEITVDEHLKLGKLVKPSTKLVKVTENLTLFKKNILPLTRLEKHYGNLLQGQVKFKYLRDLVSQLEKNNLYSKSKNTNLKFDLNDNIIIQINNGKLQIPFLKEVISVKDENNKFKVFLSKDKLYLIITFLSNQFNNIRVVFKIKTAKLLFCAKDSFDKEILKFLNKDTSKHFVREIGNISVSLNQDNEVELYTKSIKLLPIVYKDPDFKSVKKVSSSNSQLLSKPIATKDPRIGTLDIETFNETLTNGEIYARVYALGFAIENCTKMYYLIDHFENTVEGSNKLVLKCIDDMLESGLNDYTIYVHNLGKFDAIFIHKILLDFNSKNTDTNVKYILSPLYRDGKIIKLEIAKSVNKKLIKFKLVDSLNILSNSLETLCSDFGVSITKGIFPYSFVNKNNLNYIGPTPDIQFYNQTVSIDLYTKNKKSNWSLREETLNYLSQDLNSLLEVLFKFQEILWEDHNIELNKGLTIASLSRIKYMKYYLKENSIPLINNNNLFQFI